jgi:hypothetical protein
MELHVAVNYYHALGIVKQHVRFISDNLRNITNVCGDFFGIRIKKRC